MHAMKSNEVNNRTQLDSKLTADAWYVISGDFPFTGQMLRKWQDQLNWENVSSNISIIWTIDMLKEFAEKLNWKSLSSRVNFPSGFFCILYPILKHWKIIGTGMNFHQTVVFPLLMS